MSRICYIFAAGQWDGSQMSPAKGDYVIAADAGYVYLKTLGVKPDLIVGDMDSLDEAPAGVQIAKYPSVKDDTDTLLAVKIGMDKGYKEFRIFAGTGGRLDHTLANLQVLQYISRRGGQGYLVSNKQVITAITNDTMRFPKDCYDTVSVFALGETAEGVSISGMAYPLRNAKMDPYYPIGVSNKLTGKSATVSVKRGTLVIIWTKS